MVDDKRVAEILLQMFMTAFCNDYDSYGAMPLPEEFDVAGKCEMFCKEYTPVTQEEFNKVVVPVFKKLLERLQGMKLPRKRRLIIDSYWDDSEKPKRSISFRSSFGEALKDVARGDWGASFIPPPPPGPET